VEGSVAGDEFDVLLSRAKLEGDRRRRQGSYHVDKQTAGKDNDPFAENVSLDGNTQTDVGIGGSYLATVAARGDLDSGQGLDRGARGSDAGHGLELREQSVAVDGNLQVGYLLELK
jgi:hypothetical protein